MGRVRLGALRWGVLPHAYTYAINFYVGHLSGACFMGLGPLKWWVEVFCIRVTRERLTRRLYEMLKVFHCIAHINVDGLTHQQPI